MAVDHPDGGLDDAAWTPPGPGMWFLDREHVPRPLSRLVRELLPRSTVGWVTGAHSYGVPHSGGIWGSVNAYLYYQPRPPDPPDVVASLGPIAVRALRERRWADEPRRWLDDEKPRILARNRELQAIPLQDLADPDLADVLAETIEHALWAAPHHFAHIGFDFALGHLLQLTNRVGVSSDEVVGLLAGYSAPSVATHTHARAIAKAIPSDVVAVSSLDDIRTHAAVELDSYLADYGWRILGLDPADSTIGEHPGVVVQAVLAARDAPAVVDGAEGEHAVRQQIPTPEHAEFDRRLTVARANYALRDDDAGHTVAWPYGLVRRVALEVGRRAVATRRLDAIDHVFETSVEELVALASGQGPDAAELAGRDAARRQAALVDPPLVVGIADPEAAPPPPVSAEMEVLAELLSLRAQDKSSGRPLEGVGVGTERYVGTARIVDGSGESLAKVEPGDVLCAVTTINSYNAVLPTCGAIATESGGLMSHAAIVARELGIPAVVGIAGLLDAVIDGQTIEVDPANNIVRPR
ncbi:MAG: PEP-utilizing enzyme [Acidimicrobiales bacterium]